MRALLRAFEGRVRLNHDRVRRYVLLPRLTSRMRGCQYQMPLRRARTASCWRVSVSEPATAAVSQQSEGNRGGTIRASRSSGPVTAGSEL
jgi:hypothetical protein